MSTVLTSVDMWAEQITLAIARMAAGSENAPRLCESFEFFNKHSTDSSANKSTINYNWLTRGQERERDGAGRMLLSANFLSLLCFVDRQRQSGKREKGKTETSKKRKPKTVKRKLLPFRAACLINRANTAAHAVATLWHRRPFVPPSCTWRPLCARVAELIQIDWICFDSVSINFRLALREIPLQSVYFIESATCSFRWICNMHSRCNLRPSLWPSPLPGRRVCKWDSFYHGAPRRGIEFAQMSAEGGRRGSRQGVGYGIRRLRLIASQLNHQKSVINPLGGAQQDIKHTNMYA